MEGKGEGGGDGVGVFCEHCGKKRGVKRQKRQILRPTVSSVCMRRRLLPGSPIIPLHDEDPACCSTSGSKAHRISFPDHQRHLPPPPSAATANPPARRSVPCRRRLNGGQSWTRVGCADGDGHFVSNTLSEGFLRSKDALTASLQKKSFYT